MKFPQAFTVFVASLAAAGANARGDHTANADLAKKTSTPIDPANLAGSMVNLKPAIPLPGKPGWNIAADRLVTIPPQRDGSILIKGSGGNGNDLPKVVGPAGDITKLDFGGSSILINDYDTNTTSVGGYDNAVNIPPFGDIACMVQSSTTACAVDAITASAATTNEGSSPTTTPPTNQGPASTVTATQTVYKSDGDRSLGSPGGFLKPILQLPGRAYSAMKAANRNGYDKSIPSQGRARK